MAFPLENPNFAFLRFHLNVGARLAAKILAPLIALFFAALYIFKVEFFVVMARALFVDSHIVFSGLIYSAIMVGTSRLISPRICLELNGWIRHLPIKGGGDQKAGRPFYFYCSGAGAVVAVSPFSASFL
ncbi:hypothetical protein ACFLRX_02660 [Acidobacteriota bacterium]